MLFDNIRNKKPTYLYEGLIVFFISLTRREKVFLFIILLMAILGYFEFLALSQVSEHQNLTLQDLNTRYNFLLDENEHLKLDLSKRKELDDASWYTYLFGNKKK